ncbi:CAP domain-containing protein [Pyronema domesticum]|uniref:Similar to Cell wall protein PRY3 acc. no. P47033 n=1 Tax=Pyronema omphalodes (strain CBS 100304) TaxID=1076935 RepID=U4KZC9_PYROM|nr:CAP domain-containing protein [Pyronema domesticum]CCX05034.1 Similar to Cell wall protein PRY3; acc. no. P47033 [Pyronema omphalodes CBS 100304]
MKLLALSLSIILFIISVVFAEHEDHFPQKAIIYNQEVFKNDFLVLHNQLRREHDAADLVWDNHLQSSAQNWANNCVFKYSKGSYGENLATDYKDPSNSFGLWSEERQHYNFEDPRQSKAVTGHFTQVVWKGSQNLGCGAQLCERPMFPGQVDAVWCVT